MSHHRFSAIGVLALAIFSLTCPCGASTGSTFEGVISFTVTPLSSKSMTVSYFAKGNRSRMNVKSGQADVGVIMDAGKRNVLVVMPAQKTCTERPMVEPAMTDHTSERSGTFAKTGKIETILGRKCERWIYKNADRESEYWLTKGLGAFMGFSTANPIAGGGQGVSSIEIDIRKQGFFPLRIIERTGGKETSRIEVSKIEPKPLDASLFEAPADYKRVKMPAFDGR